MKSERQECPIDHVLGLAFNLAMHTDDFSVHGLPGISNILTGDDLAGVIIDGSRNASLVLQEGDVLVIASKAVSVSEGRRVSLEEVEASPEAVALAAIVGKDPRLVEVILQESKSHFLASESGPIISRHHTGLQLTSAGVDRDGMSGAFLIPRDPDASASALREELVKRMNLDKLAVIMADSDGRPDRGGSTVVAIGSAGIDPIRVTRVDLDGKVKEQRETVVDLLAAAAGVVLGQRGRGMPVVLVRGVAYADSDLGVASILHD